MKRNLILFLVATALIALGIRVSGVGRPVGSPFSISGVRLGMTVKEVQAILGPEKVEDGYLYHNSDGWEGDVRVFFDKYGKVSEVNGSRLELGDMDYTPTFESVSRAEGLPSWLIDVLGGPPFPNGRSRDFADNQFYPQYNLIVQQGCTGWYFFLRRL